MLTGCLEKFGSFSFSKPGILIAHLIGKHNGGLKLVNFLLVHQIWAESNLQFVVCYYERKLREIRVAEEESSNGCQSYNKNLMIFCNGNGLNMQYSSMMVFSRLGSAHFTNPKFCVQKVQWPFPTHLALLPPFFVSFNSHMDLMLISCPPPNYLRHQSF